MHKNHRERLKERYVTEGFEEFEEHVIMEYILFHTLPRIDTNPLGHCLLKRFGSLDRIFSETEKSLRRIRGIGPKSSALLKSISEVMLFRMLAPKESVDEYTRLSLVAEYHMRHLPHGAVSVFSDGYIFDYKPRKGSLGLCHILSDDLRAYAVEKYAVVVKGDEPWSELKKELNSGGIQQVYRLTENGLFPLN